MNQKNYEYLRDQVKFTGFGDALENDLKNKLEQQQPEFVLAHQGRFGNDTVLATLHFKQSDKSDMYFFNRYEVNFKPEHAAEILELSFYINKGHNITLKEAYNLMNGRAVNKDFNNKEGELYNAWVQLDFKQTDEQGNFKMHQFHQNYGYNLEQALGKHPIKELNDEQDKSRLLDSLKRGNRQAVTFLQNGSEQKHFVEASPRFKSINIYDSNMHRLGSKQVREENQAERQHNTTRQELSKPGQKPSAEMGVEEAAEPLKKQGRRKGHTIS
jgi:hypothetical protein